MAMSTHIRDVIAQEKAQQAEIAVLLPSNHQARQWLERLGRHRIPACLLRGYDGHANGQVKVGTYHRAKGLDFAYVYVPDRDQHPPDRYPNESEDAHRERAEVQRRQLFVAMTRARDGLWMGTRQITPGTQAPSRTKLARVPKQPKTPKTPGDQPA